MQTNPSKIARKLKPEQVTCLWAMDIAEARVLNDIPIFGRGSLWDLRRMALVTETKPYHYRLTKLGLNVIHSLTERSK